MSTLQVENLIGQTSGSNANKVIIPSGQTLDASNGFIPPAGSVVQVQNAYSNVQVVSSTSGAAINGVSLSFTPKYGNSKLLIMARVPIKVINTGSQTDGWATVRIAKSTGGLQPEPSANYEFGFNIGVSSWNDWRNVAFVQAYDTVTNTNAETYSAQGKLYNGTGTALTINESGLYKSSITIMEVAQ